MTNCEIIGRGIALTNIMHVEYTMKHGLLKQMLVVILVHVLFS